VFYFDPKVLIPAIIIALALVYVFSDLPLW